MGIKLLSFRIEIALTTTIAILSPATVTAEDDKTIDMSQLTCEKFQDLGRMEKMMSLMWFSGWMAQQNDFDFTPDRGAMSDRKDALEAACENNEGELVINQLISNE